MPHVTVAAIIERDGKFLLVEENTSAGLKLNMPAGHLEAGESLAQAVMREVLEETAYHFEPEALVGIYLASSPDKDGALTAWLRFTFMGRIKGEQLDQPLDDGIVRTVWMSTDEVLASAQHHRSAMIVASVRDYLAGQRHSMDVLHTDPSALLKAATPLPQPVIQPLAPPQPQP